MIGGETLIGDCTQPLSFNRLKGCVGNIRIRFGTWYVPKGKTPQECTYCEYCVENGCIPKSEVNPMIEEPKGVNCDCPKQIVHLTLKAPECPICQIRDSILRFSSCGSCSNCHRETPYIGQKYCAGCALQLNSCYECGQEIKDGNSYLEEIEAVLDRRINKMKKMKVSDEDIQKGINRLNEIRIRMIQRLSNKSKDEVCQMVT